jgi:hypothetical protein
MRPRLFRTEITMVHTRRVADRLFSALLRATGGVAMILVAGCGGGGYSAPSMPASTMNATAPVIVTAPASMTVAVGATATFSVAATGVGTLSYQWLRNGTAISGATGASFTTAPATAADNNATFAVMVANLYGTITSSPAMLTVM